ncbi:MAG TPA: flagellar FlbD family protein [Myxococcota bacterium]|nr:flagellar FlbD family protein [Myxococcota bacterium]
MIRLTRLNQQSVAVNPDNILWADANPDTTLCFVGGDKLMVRESIDELMARITRYQREIRLSRDAGQLPDAPAGR